MPTLIIPRRHVHASTFDFDPGQLRIPKGNGELSGRWLDSPFTLVDNLAKLFESTPATEVAARDVTKVNLQPATDESRAAFRAKYKKAIPPAWKDVNLDLEGDSGLIAKGTAANGKVQYLYSAEFEQNQAALKFDRVNKALQVRDKLDTATERINGDGTVAAVRLMNLTGMRVGATDTQQGRVRAYGATTLRISHASSSPEGVVTLSFTAKEGIPAEYTIDDPELAAFLLDRLANATDPDNEFLFGTTATKTQKWLQDTTGLASIKNHDLRTMLANLIAVAEASKHQPAATVTEYNRVRRDVAKVVSAELRNTPAQALSSYINPAVFAGLVPAPKGSGEIAPTPPLPKAVDLAAPIDTPMVETTATVADLLPLRMKERGFDQELIDSLAEKMQQAGTYLGDPVIVEQTNRGGLLTDGHHRLMAAQKAGITEIPVKLYANTPAGRLAATKALNEIERKKEA